ncbi:MAG: helix-turn-helix transcriptional regulator, partial [Cyanobacteria bacterium P01_A01_bin.40]
FLKLYEYLLNEEGGNSKSKQLPIEIYLEEAEKSKIKLNFTKAKIKKVVKHLTSKITPTIKDEMWEEAAEELLVYELFELANSKQPEPLPPWLEKCFLKIPKIFIADPFDFSNFELINSPNHKEIYENHIFYQKLAFALKRVSIRIVSDILKDLDLSSITLTNLDLVLGFEKDYKSNPIPVTVSRLTNANIAVPTFAGFGSAITAQIRKDLWYEDSNGLACFKYQAKGNPQNYIEHYISNSGDIEILPLEQAEQIIDKFGFNTVKLHLIFAAHTMDQPIPWWGKFSLKASDVIKYLGWDKRTDLPVHQKLNEIAKAAYVLDCLLVKSVWVEGRNKKGGINASTPTGRMWNVVVDPRGELNIKGKIEKPEEVYITVQPGFIFHSFLNKAGSKLREALYQFGYLAQDILKIDPYHDELALRLAIHLTMESRVHTSGTYRVETLLKHLLPHTKMDKARNDSRRGYDLKQRWDNALKLLINLRWQVQFDESYPKWLQPGSKLGKPSNVRKMKIIEWLLQAKITIQPPEPIPELISAKVKPKLSSSKKKKKIKTVTGITSDQIRKGRTAKGWSQRKLAGRLGVSNALVGYWEKGKRTPSDEMEKKLRALLEIED